MSGSIVDHIPREGARKAVLCVKAWRVRALVLDLHPACEEGVMKRLSVRAELLPWGPDLGEVCPQ